MGALDKLQKPELMKLCRDNNLMDSGTKSDLIFRLPAYGVCRNESDTSDDKNGETHLTIASTSGVENTKDDDEKLNEDNGKINEDLDNIKKRIEIMQLEMNHLIEQKQLLEKEPQLNKLKGEAKIDFNLQSIRYVEELVYEFDAKDEDFMAWLVSVMTVKRKYGIDDDVMKILVVKKLKGKALRWFYSKSDHLTMSFNDFMQQMEVMFGFRTRRLELRQKFENRSWKTDETFSEYFHDKMILSGGLNFSNEELIDFITDGVRDIDLSNQIKMQRFKVPQDMLIACANLTKKKDSARHNWNSPLRTTNNESTSSKQSLTNVDRKSNGIGRGENKLIYRCYNCNQVGHNSKDCPKEKREKGSCYRCGSKGHIIRDCPQPQN